MEIIKRNDNVDKITLRMSYYHYDKYYEEITLQSNYGFVDVYDGNGDLIFKGFAEDAIKFVNDLINN